MSPTLWNQLDVIVTQHNVIRTHSFQRLHGQVPAQGQPTALDVEHLDMIAKRGGSMSFSRH